MIDLAGLVPFFEGEGTVLGLVVVHGTQIRTPPGNAAHGLFHPAETLMPASDAAGPHSRGDFPPTPTVVQQPHRQRYDDRRLIALGSSHSADGGRLGDGLGV